MTTLYVVATFGEAIHTRIFSYGEQAKQDFLEGCETRHRVVLFEMEVEGFDKVGAHQKAYAKALHGDFVTSFERPALPPLFVDAHEPPIEQSLDDRLAALIDAEYPEPTEHECYAVEAAMQFGFEIVDDNAVWSMCRAQHISALLDHVAKHAEVKTRAKVVSDLRSSAFLHCDVNKEDVLLCIKHGCTLIEAKQREALSP